MSLLFRENSLFSCQKKPQSPRHPRLILQSQRGIRHNPPQAKGRYQRIGNSVEKDKTPVGPQIVEGEQKGHDDDKGEMAEDENGVDNEGIGEKADEQEMEGMQQVEEKKVEDGQDAVFWPVVFKHKPGKQD